MNRFEDSLADLSQARMHQAATTAYGRLRVVHNILSADDAYTTKAHVPMLRAEVLIGLFTDPEENLCTMDLFRDEDGTFYTRVTDFQEKDADGAAIQPTNIWFMGGDERLTALDNKPLDGFLAIVPEDGDPNLVGWRADDMVELNLHSVNRVKDVLSGCLATLEKRAGINQVVNV